MKRKMLVAGLLFVALLAAVLGGASLIERNQQTAREKELLSQGMALRESPWTEENTVTLGGQRYGFDHRLETFLFIGTDDSGNADPDGFRGAMADFLLLMVLDHTENTIGFLQIDRNTVTNVRELSSGGEEITTRKQQLCTAHWYGRTPEMAAENTVVAVQNLLGGLKILDGYYVMDMADIGRLNRAVEGVEITVNDDLGDYDPALRKGETLVLSDEQAFRFLRARMGVGKGANAERMARQRQYMASFFDRVQEKTLQDPRFGLNLWNTLRDIAVSNMNGNAFSRIAQKLIKGANTGIHVIKGESILGMVLGDGVRHEEFYADETSVLEEMTDLFSLVPIGDSEHEKGGDTDR